MRNFILTIALFSSFYAQSQTLEMEENFFSTCYYQGEVEITQSQFKKYLYTNAESKALYKEGKSFEVAAILFSISAGAFMGTYLGQRDRNTNNLYAGLGTFALSLILSDASSKKIKKALRVYNNGIGLTYQF